MTRIEKTTALGKLTSAIRYLLWLSEEEMEPADVDATDILASLRQEVSQEYFTDIPADHIPLSDGRSVWKDPAKVN
jgi:hypothetical protein